MDPGEEDEHDLMPGDMEIISLCVGIGGEQYIIHGDSDINEPLFEMLHSFFDENVLPPELGMDIEFEEVWDMELGEDEIEDDLSSNMEQMVLDDEYSNTESDSEYSDTN